MSGRSRTPKSLMRMLSKSGNPRMENLFAILARLQQREGTSLDIVPKPLTKQKQNAEATEARRTAERGSTRRPQRSSASRRH